MTGRKWCVTFDGRPKAVVVSGRTPEAATVRETRVRYGCQTHVHRITGRHGEPGVFVAVDRTGRPIARVDVRLGGDNG